MIFANTITSDATDRTKSVCTYCRLFWILYKVGERRNVKKVTRRIIVAIRRIDLNRLFKHAIITIFVSRRKGGHLGYPWYWNISLEPGSPGKHERRAYSRRMIFWLFHRNCSLMFNLLCQESFNQDLMTALMNRSLQKCKWYFHYPFVWFKQESSNFIRTVDVHLFSELFVR